jgi:succinyl-CoA synthetase beta subunit
MPATADVAAAGEAILDAGTPVMDERAARRVFAALGSPGPAEAVVTDLDGLSDLPLSLRYPVAAKILSPDIGHKMEAGGVVLEIADEAGLRAACRRITESVHAREPRAELSGIVVQEMERGVGEAIVGYRLDAQVGPIVLLGVGGTLAEIYAEGAVRTAPVGLDEAREMIEEVKGLAPIRGYRGMPEGDLEALARTIASLSDLARLDRVKVIEAEINPLIVKRKGEGAVAVDGLLVCDLNEPPDGA